MAEEAFGPAFEIHGGGLDLVFPHHENEVAQSRALGHPFAQIWTHNGMLQFTGEKMSKSLGNVATHPRRARRVGARDAARLLPDGALAQADRLLGGDDGAGGGPPRHAAERVHAARGRARRSALWQAFAAALDDDFDTPAALAVLHDWASIGQLELLRRGLALFGLESLAEQDEAPDEVRRLAARRADARAARDFEAADRLRDELRALGWEMRDEPAAATPSSAVVISSTAAGPCTRGAARAPRGARAVGDRASRCRRAVARGARSRG